MGGMRGGAGVLDLALVEVLVDLGEVLLVVVGGVVGEGFLDVLELELGVLVEVGELVEEAGLGESCGLLQPDVVAEGDDGPAPDVSNVGL